jgi:hypothetical protein
VKVNGLYETFGRTKEFLTLCLVAVDMPQKQWNSSTDLGSVLRTISKSVEKTYRDEINDQETSWESAIRADPVGWIKGQIRATEEWEALVEEGTFAPTSGEFRKVSNSFAALAAMSFMVEPSTV